MSHLCFYFLEAKNKYFNSHIQNLTVKKLIAGFLTSCQTDPNFQEHEVKLLYNETYINNQNVYQIDVPYSWHCKTGNYYPGFNFTGFDEIEVIRKGSFIVYCLNSDYGFEKTCIIFTVCNYLEFVKKG